MFSPSKTKKRLIKANDSYIDYAKYIKKVGHNKFTINRGGNNYTIDLNTMKCSCQDNERHGYEAPCKHIVMAFIYKYFVEREDEEGLPI